MTTSASAMKTRCLITGAGGFIGQALASALLAQPEVSHLILTDTTAPAHPASSNASKENGKPPSVHLHAADLTDGKHIQWLCDQEFDCIYLLHGIMSGQAESNLELGLNVNIDSVRRILDQLREKKPGVRLVFTSSTAVYGPPPDPDSVFSELTAPDPRSSYGAQKHIAETLVNDYSRRGLIDGRIVRLPTVTVRPGKPTGAASSFASGIFREPLSGEQSVLPVSKDLDLWVCSPRTVVKNLLLAKNIPTEKYDRKSRIVNLPGITISVQQMLDALKAVGGEKALGLVHEKKDEATQRIVEGWPTRLDTTKARGLGFVSDGPFERTLKEYIEDYTEGQH
ncbi:uncharacterized protein KY384_009185 [Bacidia gigantensis]|uniref:uncharacterized protein n=1 Tax=Bacidia gigantensis TaxID=2732470 RepID=UPI001D0567B7|nr:uncharacterized protein KY384_009185 [Bacidia gigantensis]KAG8525541.1 hypothetical protein KY384_009185 [Bacidia gigantensis]